jgi:hypothetical protein
MDVIDSEAWRTKPKEIGIGWRDVVKNVRQTFIVRSSKHQIWEWKRSSQKANKKIWDTKTWKGASDEGITKEVREIKQV